MTTGIVQGTGLQAIVVNRSAPVQGTTPIRLSMFNEDGTPFAANQSDQMPVQANVAALTQAAITGGESPTEAEFNALRADHAATRTAVNDLLAKLKTAGLMAAS